MRKGLTLDCLEDHMNVLYDKNRLLRMSAGDREKELEIRKQDNLHKARVHKTVNKKLGFRKKKALKRAGMTIDDIDLFEVNEAFAAVVLKFMRETNAPLDKINVNGGAIAMGHPLGATGAMLVGTVLDELERRDLNTALITLCIGAGMGTATIIERV